jgi:PAS domain S-box-containing protein
MLILGGLLAHLGRSLARKNASERNLTSYLAKMLKVSSDGIIVVDRALRVADINRTAERIFGRGRAAVLGCDALAEFAPRRGRAAMAARLRAALDQPDAAGTGLRRMPVVARRGDGTLFPAELSVVRVRDQDRRRVLVGFLRDLSVERNARRRTRREPGGPWPRPGAMPRPSSGSCRP